MIYFKINDNNIVVEINITNHKMDEKEYIATEDTSCELGKRWNGSTFDEVPMEEVEAPETTEVTNADLLEVLLAIGEKVGA